MNNLFSDFQDTIYENGKKVEIHRVLYDGVCIAFFRLNEHTDVANCVTEYISKYGYMAEFRKQWNLGNKVNWEESLRVVI
jgi:hypothetical protein